MQTVSETLEARPYPGRGCLAVRTTANTLVFAYFLTGRSTASQNRQIGRVDNGDVLILSGGGQSNDPLRHYAAAAHRGEWLVIGNGDQVVPLAEALSSGSEVITAWSAHTFEPDPPINTSRVWIAHRHGGADCLIGYARHAERDSGSVDHVAWAANEFSPGTGLLMTTYSGTAIDVTTTLAPASVRTAAADVDAVVRELWSALDPDLRVGAFALTAEDPLADPVIVTSRSA